MKSTNASTTVQTQNDAKACIATASEDSNSLTKASFFLSIQDSNGILAQSEFERFYKSRPTVLLLDKDIFIETIKEIFDGALDLRKISDMDKLYCPIVGELMSLYASIGHNAGPYYSPNDITPIFKILSNQLINSQMLEILRHESHRPISANDQLLNKEESTLRSYRIHRAVEPLLRSQTSVLDQRVFALIKEQDGWCFLTNPSEHRQDSVEVLEFIRQDNADKSGQTKYRVRGTTYINDKNSATEKWAITEWSNEPNFWAATLRNAISNTLKSLNETFATEGSMLAFIEGGIAKGTSTYGTDIDTTAYIICTSESHEKLAKIAFDTCSNMGSSMPFPIKQDESIRLQMYCTDTGQSYYIDRSGKLIETERESAISFEIRRNEPKIIVLYPDHFEIVSKGESLNSQVIIIDPISLSKEVKEILPSSPRASSEIHFDLEV